MADNGLQKVMNDGRWVCGGGTGESTREHTARRGRVERDVTVTPSDTTQPARDAQCPREGPRPLLRSDHFGRVFRAGLVARTDAYRKNTSLASSSDDEISILQPESSSKYHHALLTPLKGKGFHL